MSTTYTTVKQRAFPVRLDTLTLYASSWRLHGERVLSEQNGLINVSYVTSSANRSKRITLEGHFCFTFRRLRKPASCPVSWCCTPPTAFTCRIRQRQLRR